MERGTGNKIKSIYKKRSPVKGWLGKILNPMQLMPGKLGEMSGRLPGSGTNGSGGSSKAMGKVFGGLFGN